MTVTSVLEILLIAVLLIGALYFIFDIKKVLTKLIVFIICLFMLTLLEFFIGIGVHLANLVFG